MIDAERNDSDIQLLLVDDDDDFRGMTARNFRKRGFHVDEAESGDAALKQLEKRAYDVAICDISMPGMSGIELLKRIQELGTDTQVVMLTGSATVQTAVEAMKRGAIDYLTKPAQIDELVVVVQKAGDAARLQNENRQLRAVLQRSQGSYDMVGESPAMQEVIRLVRKAGPTDKPILIQGESGTGKELVARALHQASHLADKPLIVVNCAALPESLLESELFGHEKGAFTGASSAKPGLFEMADKGTLFIDEIGEMAGALQAKLLRVLEDGSLRRVGSLTERRVRVRLITATNRDIPEEVEAGRFREDLYYRIDVMTLRLPPLRERDGDIRLLASHFAGSDWQITPEAMKAIENYHWPGNVRQLINAIDRAKILADEEEICLQNLLPAVAEYAIKAPGQTDLSSLQKDHIAEILEREKGNKSRTARALGISRRALYRLLEKHGLAED